MSSKSLPPYDEYNDASPPTYTGEASSVADCPLRLPDTTEIYRATFPNYLLTAPIDGTPVVANSLAHVGVVMSTKGKGVAMICESTLTVHSSAHKSSPPVGKVTVLNSSVTDLTTFKNRGSVSGSGSIASQTKFTINEASAYSFDFDRYGRGVKESFEWVQDISDEQVEALSQSNVGKENYALADYGWKLVGTFDNTIHAVYIRGQDNSSLNPRRVMAKLRFLHVKQASSCHVNAGSEWRLVVAISVLGMVEQERRAGVGERARKQDTRNSLGTGIMSSVFGI